MHEQLSEQTRGLMAPPSVGRCAPLMGRPQPPAPGLLSPTQDLPAPSLAAALWGFVAVLAPTLLLVAVSIDVG